MNTAEKLARAILRVAQLRGQIDLVGGRYTADSELAVIDADLDQACRAIGSADPVAMEAAGQQLERITT